MLRHSVQAHRRRRGLVLPGRRRACVPPGQRACASAPLSVIVNANPPIPDCGACWAGFCATQHVWALAEGCMHACSLPPCVRAEHAAGFRQGALLPTDIGVRVAGSTWDRQDRYGRCNRRTSAVWRATANHSTLTYIVRACRLKKRAMELENNNRNNIKNTHIHSQSTPRREHTYARHADSRAHHLPANLGSPESL